MLLLNSYYIVTTLPVEADHLDYGYPSAEDLYISLTAEGLPIDDRAIEYDEYDDRPELTLAVLEEKFGYRSIRNEKRALEASQEQQKKERTSQYKGSLQPEAEGSTAPVSEIDTFDRSVTSRPTKSSYYLNFTIKDGFKSRRTRLDQSVDMYNCQ